MVGDWQSKEWVGVALVGSKMLVTASLSTCTFVISPVREHDGSSMVKDNSVIAENSGIMIGLDGTRLPFVCGYDSPEVKVDVEAWSDSSSQSTFGS